jgi:hypothetical protein
MAINFETSDPHNLLASFKKAINAKHVVTWSYDADGDFTHTPDQWKNRAWLRPVIYQGRLTMNLLGRKSVVTSKELYGVYHGRFIESMLAHCDSLFTSAIATAMPTNSDVITTKVA